jgi:hypothetical protein
MSCTSCKEKARACPTPEACHVPLERAPAPPKRRPTFRPTYEIDPPPRHLRKPRPWLAPIAAFLLAVLLLSLYFVHRYHP